MLERIEFYNCPDGSVNIKPFDAPMFVYEQQSCKKITQEMIVLIRDLYPLAGKFDVFGPREAVSADPLNLN